MVTPLPHQLPAPDAPLALIQSQVSPGTATATNVLTTATGTDGEQQQQQQQRPPPPPPAAVAVAPQQDDEGQEEGKPKERCPNWPACTKMFAMVDVSVHPEGHSKPYLTHVANCKYDPARAGEECKDCKDDAADDGEKDGEEEEQEEQEEEEEDDDEEEEEEDGEDDEQLSMWMLEQLPIPDEGPPKLDDEEKYRKFAHHFRSFSRNMVSRRWADFCDGKAGKSSIDFDDLDDDDDQEKNDDEGGMEQEEQEPTVAPTAEEEEEDVREPEEGPDAESDAAEADVEQSLLTVAGPE